MDYKSAMKQIQQGKIAPVYVCYGSESYLIHALTDRLTEQLVDPEHKSFAVTKYDLAETPLDTVIEEAETLPFMVPKKLVIAANALFLTGAKDSSKVEHKPERLTEYMRTPADFSVIVFTVNADKLDERKKLVKSLKEANCLVPCASLSADDLTGWVRQEAEKAGFTFAPGVIEQFILYTGTNLQALSSELEKCALFVGRGGVLSADALDQLVTRSIEQNIFILIEHIVQLQLEKAFTMLSELLRRKEEPIKIMSLIARQFRIMFQVKDLQQQGYSQQQMASQLGLHPYAVKVASGQSSRFELKKLASILDQLSDLDYQMKSGKIDKVLGLEMFLLKLIA
ncbi:DNA polymerase III subunit delta [Paenibacillus doosanensis]|uniref:DNA polymerase III subunit delta n=1 Tax=Paenibacillus konkukensis TaxID=2020716 RepID=A0ABY4RXS7_9BACL|nr:MULTISPECIES: DNA polymerase III subunit delta [Paenibacillus]MCS7458519.1 DNA polymerase III subunit delta [Paenibacillus doosanensis]UQZ86957.1 DNA polymerase III subunit delta [Paenibacillus konkukensis]